MSAEHYAISLHEFSFFLPQLILAFLASILLQHKYATQNKLHQSMTALDQESDSELLK